MKSDLAVSIRQQEQTEPCLLESHLRVSIGESGLLRESRYEWREDGKEKGIDEEKDYA